MQEPPQDFLDEYSLATLARVLRAEHANEPGPEHTKSVQAATQTYAADVAKKGAILWLYEPRINLYKAMIVDDEVRIVATANMDNRSLRLNFEVVAAIYDRDVTTRLTDMFENDLEACRPCNSDIENTGIMTRIMDNSARLLSPMF